LLARGCGTVYQWSYANTLKYDSVDAASEEVSVRVRLWCVATFLLLCDLKASLHTFQDVIR